MAGGCVRAAVPGGEGVRVRTRDTGRAIRQAGRQCGEFGGRGAKGACRATLTAAKSKTVASTRLRRAAEAGQIERHRREPECSGGGL